MKLIIGICLAIILAIVILVASPSNRHKPKIGLEIGDVVPDVKLRDVVNSSQSESSLYKYLGLNSNKKYVVLVFWGAWSDLCKKEIPDLIVFNNKWKNKGVQVVSVVIYPDKIESHPNSKYNIIKIIDEKKINYPVCIDEEGIIYKIIEGGSGPIPYKVIIDYKGVIRYVHQGENINGTKDDLDKIILDVMKIESYPYTK
jgi:peroxiredoxin